MNKFYSKLIAPFEIIKIIYKFEPLYLVFAFPQIIIKAILPLLYIYFPKLIIEQLTDPQSQYQDILITIFTFGGILLLLNIANSFLKNKSDYYSDLFSKRLKNEIGKISMRMELKDIERPEAQDTIKLANEATELTKSMGLVQNILSNIITIIGVAYIVIRLNFIIIILLVFTLSVKVLSEHLQFNHNKKIRKLQSANSRFVEYLFNISYFDEGAAKEIRLNSLQDWYMDKTRKSRNEMVRLHYKSFRLSAFFNIIVEIIVAIQSFIILILLARNFIDGNISIADFTMFFSAITTLTTCLSAITEQIRRYSQQILGASDYKKITNLIAEKTTFDERFESSLSFSQPEIEFIDVSFAYPHSDKLVLKNINIKISNQEKLVIVGANGAGKSTFIKLLCKFYRPSSGKITINGIDIWDIPNEEYYKLIAAVFQDFANFAFSIKENIAMSEESDEQKIAQIINQINLQERISELPNGLDTHLTKSFDTSGIELSGGQGQKVAIARAIYKDTPILILDEPTASLDPKAENEIYQDFFKMAKSKTTIFISHRLAASTLADNIAVFSEGEIIEYGSHNNLINKKGVYAEMYRKQSEKYLEEEQRIF